MAAPVPSTDAKAELRQLLADARRHRDDYEAIFQQYEANEKWNRVFGAIGVEAAYEYYGIPKGISRDAVNGFLKRWEASPQFRDFRQRFESLLDRVGGFLRGVSESVPSLRPNGNSAKLLAKLSRVRTPARLDTKMRYLIAVLEDLDTRTLVRNQDIPPRRSVPRTTSKKVRSPPPSADPALAWTLVGVILSVFIGVAIGLFPFAGWISIPAAVIATGALVLTRRLWVEPVAGLASAKRR
jgi:hypothetical protein